METGKVFSIKDYGAAEGGKILSTRAIQQAVDVAAKEQGEVLVPAGVYLTGSVFLHSNMRFYLEKGAVLLGSMDEADYPLTFSRVAGVEMEWPAGVLNVINQENVRIYGEGMIDGQGEFWWNKYWGQDRRGGMRAEYERKGLRWAVDYDCLRARNVVVFQCRNVQLEGFHSIRSGFWNVHLCYSEDIVVRGLQIHDNSGPSTDGVDIDSCKGVLVEGCTIACNDDNICIKSGRDGDGLRVNRPCEDVTIQNCSILEGAGVTLGSETSGGIRDIVVRNISFKRTSAGFRMKSARTRGGVLERITVENLEMEDVACAFSFDFDWNPAYSYCVIPADHEGEIPKRWTALTQPVLPEKGIPEAYDIHVRNVESRITPGHEKDSAAFRIRGMIEKPFHDIHFQNGNIQAKSFGEICNVINLEFVNVKVSVMS
ncbi:MAG TPA: glycoside hydrolase family 28 [Lachnospiraceae bacterium]|nr:glycoside hydrolase family 28 [Lachnospiraceae bacterium]